jgi:hypothetical protein
MIRIPGWIRNETEGFPIEGIEPQETLGRHWRPSMRKEMRTSTFIACAFCPAQKTVVMNPYANGATPNLEDR